MQCVAAYYRVLQCVAVCCSMLQICCSVSQGQSGFLYFGTNEKRGQNGNVRCRMLKFVWICMYTDLFREDMYL